MKAADVPRVPQERLHPIGRPSGPQLLNKTGTWRYIRPIYRDRLAPCTNDCPTGVKMREYFELVEQGELEKAWRTLKQDNPIPAITGRVCYHPCEEACNRLHYDQPLAIHSLERLVGDYGLGLTIDKPEITEKERVAVVGSGPAGLAAAYHLIKQGYGVTVFEAESQLGGMLRWGIPQYRLPRDILDKEIASVGALGVVFRLNSRLGTDIGWEDLNPYQAVFIATGCQRGQQLHVAGEDASGVRSGPEFLRDVNTSHFNNTALAGQRVTVIGGGNVAVDCARSARRLGAAEVSVVCLESSDDMPASATEIKQAEEEGVQIYPSRAVARILTDAGNVTGLECLNVSGLRFSPDGQPQFDTVDGSQHSMSANMVITAIGQVADVAFLPEELVGEDGKLVPERLGKAGDKIILAGGDVVTGPARVVDALAAGKRAAATIEALLKEKPLDHEEDQAVVDYEELNTLYFCPLPRQEVEPPSPAQRLTGFKEVDPGLSGEAASKESQRCFHCGSCNLCGNCWLFCPDMSILESDGHLEIDYEFCKGCGICAEECPRAAIQTEEESE